ncbi:TPA: hypothetical protein VEP96_004813 [Pseudomonas aeruginosa]|nr:hypothetical protein [Pseudomonas aeruginosa]
MRTYFNALYYKQEISFKQQFGFIRKVKNNAELIDELLENETLLNLTISLDPRIHSMNSFFTFFLVHDHSLDKLRNIGFSDLLWIDENSRLIYAGSLKEEERSFCGVQSKEFYSLCEFITEHNLWPDRSDLRKKHSRTIKGKVARPFKNSLRTLLRKATFGWLCKASYDDLIKGEVRGYKTILNALKTHHRQDLIDLCEKYSASSTFPLVLRSVAEVGPEKIMSLTADESILYAMEKFYSHKYKMNIFVKTKKVYIPKAVEVINVFSNILVKK